MAMSMLLHRLDATITVHGFRSSFRDWAAETGVEFSVAEQCLAHAIGGNVDSLLSAFVDVGAPPPRAVLVGDIRDRRDRRQRGGAQPGRGVIYARRGLDTALQSGAVFLRLADRHRRRSCPRCRGGNDLGDAVDGKKTNRRLGRGRQKGYRCDPRANRDDRSFGAYARRRQKRGCGVRIPVGSA